MTKLWLVSRTDRIGYDEYDSMVVAADNEEDALSYHPNGYVKAKLVGNYWKFFRNDTESSLYGEPYYCNTWSDVGSLYVEYLGTTDRNIKGVVLASFNAG